MHDLKQFLWLQGTHGTGKMAKKDSLSGKTQEILSKHREYCLIPKLNGRTVNHGIETIKKKKYILFIAQVVNVLILKV